MNWTKGEEYQSSQQIETEGEMPFEMCGCGILLSPAAIPLYPLNSAGSKI